MAESSFLVIIYLASSDFYLSILSLYRKSKDMYNMITSLLDQIKQIED